MCKVKQRNPFQNLFHILKLMTIIAYFWRKGTKKHKSGRFVFYTSGVVVSGRTSTGLGMVMVIPWPFASKKSVSRDVPSLML